MIFNCFVTVMSIVKGWLSKSNAELTLRKESGLLYNFLKIKF